MAIERSRSVLESCFHLLVDLLFSRLRSNRVAPGKVSSLIPYVFVLRVCSHCFHLLAFVTMWRFFHILIALFFVFIFTSVTALPHAEPSNRIDEGDTSLLIQEFYRAVEEGINHLVVSRDMHKLVRHKRQLNNFGSGGFGQGGFGQGGFGQGGGGLGGLLGGLGGGGGGGGFGQGGFLDSVTNLASLASLDSLGSGAASGLPIL